MARHKLYYLQAQLYHREASEDNLIFALQPGKRSPGSKLSSMSLQEEKKVKMGGQLEDKMDRDNSRLDEAVGSLQQRLLIANGMNTELGIASTAYIPLSPFSFGRLNL